MFELEPYSSSPDEPILLKDYLDYITPKLQVKNDKFKIYLKSDCFKCKLKPDQELKFFFENVMKNQKGKFQSGDLEIEFNEKLLFKVHTSSKKYVSEMSFEPNLDFCKQILSLN
jgi:hypothetical protein